MRRFLFDIQLTKDDGDGLVLASAIGFTGGGSTVKEALDAWVDSICNDAIEQARRRATKDE